MITSAQAKLLQQEDRLQRSEQMRRLIEDRDAQDLQSAQAFIGSLKSNFESHLRASIAEGYTHFTLFYTGFATSHSPTWQAYVIALAKKEFEPLGYEVAYSPTSASGHPRYLLAWD